MGAGEGRGLHPSRPEISRAARAPPVADPTKRLARGSGEIYYTFVTMNSNTSAAGLVALGALALPFPWLVACSGAEEPTGAGGSAIVAGGGSGAGATLGGSGGEAGTSSSGGTAGDAGSGNVEPDAAAGGTGAGGTGVQSGFMYPPGCPVPTPEPVPGQTIVIQSVNFITSEVVIRNVSDSDVEVIAGRQGWQWCAFPAYWNLILSEDPADNVTLSPGETFAFPAVYNQNGLWPMTPEGGEMAIYVNTGSFMTASQMRAFVSWGEAPSSRENVAVMGGYWTNSDRIAVAITAAGFVITGRSDRASGYRAVREECLVHPPNEQEVE